jgi:hypothetical protein
LTSEVIIDHVLAVLASASLVWAAVKDVRTRHVSRIAGFGILVIGLGHLFLNSLWLESSFFLTAIWGSRGGVWRVPVLVLAVVLLSDDFSSLPYVLGILYILVIFDWGWFGGGDAQLAIGLIALGRDWWILAYLFGGTILLGLALMFRRRGLAGGFERFWFVLNNLEEPDEEAIQLPWAVLASAGGLAYIWLFPGLM